MGKAETVAKYIDEYLSGKSPHVADKFRAKDVNKQYSSIMAWRRKMRQEESTPESADVIIENLKRVSTLISNAPSMSDDEIEHLYEQLRLLRNQLDQYKESQRARRISELEQRQQEIARELLILRGEEPNLFS